jgi:hypothetical protein
VAEEVRHEQMAAVLGEVDVRRTPDPLTQVHKAREVARGIVHLKQRRYSRAV